MQGEPNIQPVSSLLDEYLASMQEIPFLESMRNGLLTRDQMYVFAESRFGISDAFEVHLKKALEHEITQGRNGVAAVLQQNYREEIGEEGRPHTGHGEARHAFYKLLGVDTEAGQLASPDFDALAFNHSMARLVKLGHGAGGILLREFATPIEFKAMREQLKKLMPDVFGVDKPRGQQAKLAAHYLNDHIGHDANAHGPDLLGAIDAYSESLDAEERSTFITSVKIGVIMSAAITYQFYGELTKRIIGIPWSATIVEIDV